MNYGLKTGLGVYTKDGTLLGQVGALRGDEFKVDAPLALDYWLPKNAIDSVRLQTVLLVFDHAELARYKREPGEALDESKAGSTSASSG